MRTADPSFRGVLLGVACLREISKRRKGGLGPNRGRCATKKKREREIHKTPQRVLLQNLLDRCGIVCVNQKFQPVITEVNKIRNCTSCKINNRFMKSLP
jgi:hypothetical protein